MMNGDGEDRVELRSGRWSGRIQGALVAACVASCMGCAETTSTRHSEEPRVDNSDDEPRVSRSSRGSRSRGSRASRDLGESRDPESGGGTKSGSVVGRPLPDLRLAALNGGRGVRLGDFRGKVVLLDVWASWCAPCKQELPMLDDMAGRLRRKGIEIVAVSIDDSREEAEEFLKSRRSWSIKLAHDPDQKLPGKLQPPKMPSSYFVDRNGVIRQVNAGFEQGDAQKIESRLVALAEEG